MNKIDIETLLTRKHVNEEIAAEVFGFYAEEKGLDFLTGLKYDYLEDGLPYRIEQAFYVDITDCKIICKMAVTVPASEDEVESFKQLAASGIDV